MWEAIGNVLSGSNGVAVGLLIVLVIVLVFICAKLGLINIKTDKISVGREASETERTIVRNQIEWCQMACRGFECQVPRQQGYDIYRGKYITELVIDEMTSWVYFNHIESRKTYIELKQDIVWNIVQANVERDELRTESFRRSVYELVEHIIERLVSIREEYD